MRTFIIFAVVLGITLVVGSFYDKMYSPASSKPSSKENTTVSTLPIKCGIIITDSQKNSGNEISGLNIGLAGTPIGLVRPVGAVLADYLPNVGRKFFSEIRLISDRQQCKECEVIITLNSFNFENKTGYDFKGLPMLIAYGNAFASLSVEVEVSGPKIEPFSLKKTGEGVTRSGLVLFPFSRLKRSMTEATDFAAASASNKLMEGIAQASNLKNLEDARSN